MMVELSKLAPNPFRNFRVDPIDEANVQQLMESISEHSFWGGVTCRKLKNGTYQIAAGHHRIEAAKRLGFTVEDIHVGDFSDEQMIRIYAVENATQRGNTSTAMGGSVASAVRYIAKDLLVNGTGSQFWEPVKERGHQQVDPADLGEPIITKFLHGIQGINKSSVAIALKQIKASGEYASILTDVQTEIEAENREVMKAAEQAKHEADAAEASRKEAAERKRIADEAYAKAQTEAAQRRAEHERQVAEANAKLAEKRQREAAEQSAKFDAVRKTDADTAKAVTKSAEREITFDRNGVAPYFTNANHLTAFQKCVEGDGIKPYLRVGQQAALAAALVAEAKRLNRDLTGAFIHETIVEMVLKVKDKQRELKKEEQESLLRSDLQAKARKYQDDFSRSCRGMTAAGGQLSALMKDWPKYLPLPITGEFREALRHAAIVIEQLTKKV